MRAVLPKMTMSSAKVSMAKAPMLCVMPPALCPICVIRPAVLYNHIKNQKIENEKRLVQAHLLGILASSSLAHS